MSSAAVTAYAKGRSGIRSVEEAVKSVNGPIYDKFHLVPDEVLRITDHSAAEAHRPTAPSPTTASDIAGAVYAKCEPAVKVLYERYVAKAEQCALAAWQRLFPRLPKAAHWTEKYNEKAMVAAEKACRVSTLFSEKRA